MTASLFRSALTAIGCSSGSGSLVAIAPPAPDGIHSDQQERYDYVGGGLRPMARSRNSERDKNRDNREFDPIHAAILGPIGEFRSVHALSTSFVAVAARAGIHAAATTSCKRGMDFSPADRDLAV